MGCDIHWVVEVKLENGWLGVLTSDTECLASKRNYLFFTELGLLHRGESITALSLNGWPQDPSELADFHRWESRYYHSLSHLPLCEFIEAYKRSFLKWNFGDSKKIINEKVLFSTALYLWDQEKRIVFGFDN